MFQTNAKRTPDVTALERENAAVARSVAAEGIVLLQNNGLLPLHAGTRIALYGEGAEYTVKGGTGSGEVNCRHVVGIREGLENAGFPVTTAHWLDSYQSDFEARRKEFDDDIRRRSGFMNFGAMNYLLQHPFQNPQGPAITGEYLSDPSDVCIYVISRQAGENTDRMPREGDFLFSERETENLCVCAAHYQHLILVINVGGSMDLSILDEMSADAVIFFGQQGQEGGNAFADILTGRTTPAGHLSFTWVRSYDDVPYGEDFSVLNGNTEYEEYREGIYVGYRYYSTFHVPVRWPFGFGMSYTEFTQKTEVNNRNGAVFVSVTVQNIGKCAGKHVVQLYVSCPPGRLEKELKRLVAFGKTGLLAPGESETLSFSIALKDLASFDEESLSWVLEPGEYLLLSGTDAEQTDPAAALALSKELILSRHSAICPVRRDFPQLQQSESLLARNQKLRESWLSTASLPRLSLPENVEPETYGYERPLGVSFPEREHLQQLLSGKETLDFLAGDGLDIGLPKHHDFIVPGADAYTPAKYEKRGLPSINFCDGPAGLRLFDISVKTGNTVRMGRPVMESFARLPKIARMMMIRKPKPGKTLYQYATAFPSGMSLAQSWSRDVLRRVGYAVQKEMEAFGVEVWLAPGINLYRNPLCGRIYEYYSEDPVLSGNLAAALIQSVQNHEGYVATIKHFVCNNQEINRRNLSADIYPRPLREIYLRNFEIGMSQGKPGALMTSYNKINGVYAAENEDLVTKVIRQEWQYDGLIMTDWTTEQNMLDAARAIRAGVNIMMPGIASDHKTLHKAWRSGQLSEQTIRNSASYLLRLITRSRLYKATKQKGERK